LSNGDVIENGTFGIFFGVTNQGNKNQPLGQASLNIYSIDFWSFATWKM